MFDALATTGGMPMASSTGKLIRLATPTVETTTPAPSPAASTASASGPVTAPPKHLGCASAGLRRSGRGARRRPARRRPRVDHHQPRAASSPQLRGGRRLRGPSAGARRHAGDDRGARRRPAGRSRRRRRRTDRDGGHGEGEHPRSPCAGRSRRKRCHHRRLDRAPRRPRRGSGLRHRRPRGSAPGRLHDVRRVGRPRCPRVPRRRRGLRGGQERARRRGHPRAARDAERAGARLRHRRLPELLAAGVGVPPRLAGRLRPRRSRPCWPPRTSRTRPGPRPQGWSSPTRCRPTSSGTRVEHDRVLAEAFVAADAAGVRGKEVTPFLLAFIVDASGGRSLEVNLALARNNVRVAADVATAYAARRIALHDGVVAGPGRRGPHRRRDRQAARPDRGRHGHPEQHRASRWRLGRQHRVLAGRLGCVRHLRRDGAPRRPRPPPRGARRRGGGGCADRTATCRPERSW